MTKTIEAVFENGVFRPLQPVEFEEGRRVLVEILLPPVGPVAQDDFDYDAMIRENRRLSAASVLAAREDGADEVPA